MTGALWWVVWVGCGSQPEVELASVAEDVALEADEPYGRHLRRMTIAQLDASIETVTGVRWSEERLSASERGRRSRRRRTRWTRSEWRSF